MSSNKPSATPPAASSSSSTTTASEEVKRKKRKKPVGTKEERRQIREAEKLNKFYAPKDSHVSVITPEIFLKLKEQRGYSSSTSSGPKTSTANNVSFLKTKSTSKIGLSTPHSKEYFEPLDFPKLGDDYNKVKGKRKGQSDSQNVSISSGSITKEDWPSLTEDESTATGEDLHLIEEDSEWETENELNSNPKKNLKIIEESHQELVELAKDIDMKATNTTPINSSAPVIISSKKSNSQISKKLSKKPIEIPLIDLLNSNKVKEKMKKSERLANQVKQREKTNVTFGNILDSSGPAIMKRGKMREKQKAKKPSRLKKAILLTRSSRKVSINPTFSNTSNNKNVTNASLQDNSENVQDINEVICIDIASEDEPENLNEHNITENTENANENMLAPIIKIEHNLIIVKANNDNSIESSEFKPDIKTEELDIKIKIPEIDNTEDQLNEMLNKMKGSSNEEVDEEQRKIQKLFEYVNPSSSTLSDNQNQHQLDICNNMESNNIEISKLSPEIVEAAKKSLHSRKFRNYCDMYTNKELHGKVIELLKELHRFQDKLYHTDPIKFQLKRRYVNGLRDVENYLKINKLCLIIIAPDIEPNNIKGGLDDMLDKIIKGAQIKKIPYIFSGNRYILGKTIKIKTPISAIGILDKQGTEALFNDLMMYADELRKKYQKEFEERLIETLKSKENSLLISSSSSDNLQASANMLPL